MIKIFWRRQWYPFPLGARSKLRHSYISFEGGSWEFLKNEWRMSDALFRPPYLPGRIAGGGRTFLTDFIWMASISKSIGATEVLVPYFCQARDGGYEYGSYSQYRAHLAIFQPNWRKGWHRPKLGIISYVISAFLPLFCQKVTKIDPSGRIRAIFSYKKAF